MKAANSMGATMKFRICLAVAFAIAFAEPSYGQSCTGFPYNNTNGLSNGSGNIADGTAL